MNLYILLFIISILLIVCLIDTILIYKLKKPKQQFNVDYGPSLITPQTKLDDLTLLNESIDRAIIKTLYIFIQKDHVFSDNSPIKTLISKKYRDLISYLIRTDLFFEISNVDDQGNEIKEYKSFFISFINKVYISFIHETSPYIINLYYKYYTGKTEYMKKEDEPSILDFIVEYVRGFLWKRFMENQIAEEKLLSYVKTINNGSEEHINYMKLLDSYDSSCYNRVCLDFYNINNLDNYTQKVPENGQKYVKNELNNTNISDFAYNFSIKTLEKSNSK